MKVVIVGGVAGGASAAARIRRLDEHAQIIMIERSGYVSYANCGLPYYVGGVIKEQEELTLQTPESFWDRFRIDVRVRQEVTAINPTEKTVTVHALDSGKVYTETYDKLLLAPGAKPTVPALSGVSSERVFTLRTVEDTLRIRRFVEDQKPKTAVLAGGGFIGLEMAENLVEMGVSVTIVQRPKQLLAPLDADMASFVHAEMRRHGVALRLGETVTGFRQDGDSVLTLLEESEPLRSDMVLLAIGVTPDTHLAKEAGLELGIREQIGSISFVVDMRRNKDVCKRGRCVPNIGSAFKYVQQFPNQTINCCRIIVIQNVALVIIACSCIDRSLICFVINNECRIFCRNFLFSSNNFRTVIFSKESENLAQDGCILFCDNHKGRHHRNALGLFVDITFFIARCNRLNTRFNLVIGAYTNANCITLPRHISDTF